MSSSSSDDSKSDTEGTECGFDCWLKRCWVASQERGLRTLSSGSPCAKLPPVSTECMQTRTKLLYGQQPLQDWQTRLIILEGGTRDSPLSCRLVTVDLIAKEGVGVRETGEVVQYEAVSYSWGYPDFTVPILCNDVEYYITEGLHDALVCLRRENAARYLWIDAVCIDQYNLAEKARQVGNMLLIFRKARSVMAWLGRPDFPDLFPFEILCNMDIPLDEVGPAFPDGESHETYLSSATTLDNVDDRHDRICQEIWTQLQPGLTHLFSRPWFHRTWVRQESFAARRLMFQLGDRVLESEKLIRNAHFFQTRTNFESRNLGIITQFMKLGRQPEDPVQCFSAYCLGILTSNAYFQATDSRDRIYGLAGMIFDVGTMEHFYDRPRSKPADYPIDYRKGLSEVYQDMAIYLLETTRSLEMLHVFQDRKPTTSQFPSWVINWEISTPRYYSNHDFYGELGDYKPPVMAARGDYPGELSVRGRTIGRIASQIGVIGPTVGESEWVSDWRMTSSTFHGTPNANRESAGFTKRTFDEFLRDCSYTAFTVSWIGGVDKYIEHKAFTGQKIYSMNAFDQIYASDVVRGGDILAYFNGLESLVCLRRQDQGNRYEFLGPVVMASHVQRRAGGTPFWAPLGGTLLDEAFGGVLVDPMEEFLLI